MKLQKKETQKNPIFREWDLEKFRKKLLLLI